MRTDTKRCGTRTGVLAGLGFDRARAEADLAEGGME